MRLQEDHVNLEQNEQRTEREEDRQPMALGGTRYRSGVNADVPRTAHQEPSKSRHARSQDSDPVLSILMETEPEFPDRFPSVPPPRVKWRAFRMGVRPVRPPAPSVLDGEQDVVSRVVVARVPERASRGVVLGRRAVRACNVGEKLQGLRGGMNLSRWIGAAGGIISAQGRSGGLPAPVEPSHAPPTLRQPGRATLAT